MNCVFCDIAKHKISANIVYEDELVTAFLDSDPINEGHVLVIPKEHFSDFDKVPDKLISHIMYIAKKIVKAICTSYTPDGFSIMCNGGLFNDIGHFHLHIFPRYTGDGFGWTASTNKTECSQTVAEKIAVTLQT